MSFFNAETQRHRVFSHEPSKSSAAPCLCVPQVNYNLCHLRIKNKSSAAPCLCIGNAPTVKLS